MNSEIVELKKKDILSMYQKGNAERKSMLKEMFASYNFLSEKITDRIKTFEDALEIFPPSPNIALLLDYDGLDPDMIAALNFVKAIIITRALNEGWEPDWNNSNQSKWYPWFYMNPPVFRFYYSRCGITVTSTAGGSRLCFKTSELAEYAAKQFLSIYKKLLTT
jgi:hypothetical protein